MLGMAAFLSHYINAGRPRFTLESWSVVDIALKAVTAMLVTLQVHDNPSELGDSML